MVQAIVLSELEECLDGARFGISAPPHNPLYPGIHERTRAHGARLQGDVATYPHHPPTPKASCRLTKSDQLCMGGRVLGGFPQVVPAGDDSALVNENRTHGDFSPLLSPSRLDEGFAHKVVVFRHV